jgi:hypothetical protein
VQFFFSHIADVQDPVKGSHFVEITVSKVLEALSKFFPTFSSLFMRFVHNLIFFVFTVCSTLAIESKFSKICLWFAYQTASLKCACSLASLRFPTPYISCTYLSSVRSGSLDRTYSALLRSTGAHLEARMPSLCLALLLLFHYLFKISINDS